MSLLESIPIIGKWFDRGFDLADQAIVDKDKVNELIAHLEEGKDLIEKEVYLRALGTKTVPWVDALHKMGRQILNFVTIIAVLILIALDHTITQWDVLLLGGPNTAYQFMKKVGK